MVRFVVASLSIVVALGACASQKSQKKKKKQQVDEFAELGRSEASSEPPTGLYARVIPGDAAAIAQRGKLLFDMERALRLAHEQGVARVGEPPDEVILPVVEVDPGGKSAQVVFLRWPKEADRARLAADDAHRWLLVSLLLEPERVIDVELLHGPVVRHSTEHLHAGAIIEAAKALRELAPEGSFSMLSLFEQADGGNVVARVYAFAHEPGSPDVEFVVAPPKKRKGSTPALLSTRTTHPPGVFDAESVRLDDHDQLTEMTVTRVMLRGPEAAPVSVHTRSGAWRVMPADGRVLRDG